MKAKKDYKSEVLDIIRTKDWNRARWSNDKNLYEYIKCHKDTDEDCKIIWEHISRQSRDYKSEISDIIRTKDWNRARNSNDGNLYKYIKCHRDTDEDCKIIWEHISQQSRDYESEISDIIRTKDWNRARRSNDRSLYNYIRRHRDTDENCRIIWEHIAIERHCPYTIKNYLLNYFKYRKTKNESLRSWFYLRIKKGNQCCIDIKNLIVAAENYQDPVALETLELIKNHLENKEGD